MRGSQLRESAESLPRARRYNTAGPRGAADPAFSQVLVFGRGDLHDACAVACITTVGSCQMNDNINYLAAAELFPAPSHRRAPLHYRRFETLAEAVQFVEETLPIEGRQGAVIESEEVRYTGEQITNLYRAVGYPLGRSTPN